MVARVKWKRKRGKDSAINYRVTEMHQVMRQDLFAHALSVDTADGALMIACNARSVKAYTGNRVRWLDIMEIAIEFELC